MKSNFTLLSIVLLLSISMSSYSQDTYKLDENYSIDPNGTIKLVSDDASVIIRGSDRSDVHVYIYRKVTVKGIGDNDSKFEFDISQSGGNLSLIEKSSSRGWTVGYQKEEYEIEIEAPRGVSLNVRGDDDDYEIKNINGSIILDIDDGDVSMSGCGGDRFEINMDDGDLYMDEGAGILVLDIDDGDARIENAEFESLDAGFDDGDFELTTSLSANGEYNIRSSDGYLEMNMTRGGGTIDIKHDDCRIDTEGSFNLKRKEENRTVLLVSGGEAKVNIRADDAKILLVN